MRVLQIHNRYRYSGGEDAVVSNERNLLLARGAEVRQLIFTNDAIRPGTLFLNKDSYARARSQIRDFRPDIVHVHNVFYKASPSVLMAAREENLPVVMTLHNFRLLCTGALFLRDGQVCTKCKDLIFPVHGVRHRCFQGSLTRSFALSSLIGYTKLRGTWTHSVDRFIALTPFIKELLEHSSLKPRTGQVVVKANSTDDLSQPGFSAAGRKGFLFIGRLSEEKGAEVLIQAFNQIPATSLTIIGEGPLEDQLRAAAGPNIRFMGRQPREVIKQELNAARAMVFPSVCYEGLPNTIMEAFSTGTPVIASDVDNINSLVAHQHNGLLFETGNPASLVERIQQLDTDESFNLGRNARAEYEQNYTHEANYRALMQIYEELL